MVFLGKSESCAPRLVAFGVIAVARVMAPRRIAQPRLANQDVEAALAKVCRVARRGQAIDRVQVRFEIFPALRLGQFGPAQTTSDIESRLESCGGGALL